MPNYRQSMAHNLLKERKVNIVSEIPDRVKCIICKNVIVNAKQSPCGCRYCCDCIVNYLGGKSKFCPGKTIECQEEEIRVDDNVINDFATDREIRRLRFRCQNIGCAFEDEVRLMDEHLLICQYGEEICELCSESLPRMNVSKHMMDECQNRLIMCHYCGNDFTALTMDAEHGNLDSDKLCAKFVCVCPLKCNIETPIVIGTHRLVCANRARNCPYELVGCPAKGYTKRDLNNHIKESIFDHSKILFDALAKSRDEVASLKSQMAQMNSFVWKINNFSSFLDSKTIKNNRNRFSPEFSLAPSSYRALIEMNLDCDYLMLYFAIVKGDYDNILRWPFDKTVTIAILDQSGQDKHYTKTMKTSPEPSCFQKPSGSKKGLGWDRFIDLDVLRVPNHLLMDDCLFIKCTVHC